MNEKLKKFRAEAARVGPSKAGRKFPRHLRALAAEYADERRVAGAAWRGIAVELGVATPTVKRWCKQPSKAATFAPVTIVEEHRRAGFTAIIGALRVEGLDLDSLVALAKALS